MIALRRADTLLISDSHTLVARHLIDERFEFYWPSAECETQNLLVERLNGFLAVADVFRQLFIVALQLVDVDLHVTQANLLSEAVALIFIVLID